MFANASDEERKGLLEVCSKLFVASPCGSRAVVIAVAGYHPHETESIQVLLITGHYCSQSHRLRTKVARSARALSSPLSFGCQVGKLGGGFDRFSNK